VVRRVEVFGRDLQGEGNIEELVQDRDDVATACYSKRTILNVLAVHLSCRVHVREGRSLPARLRAPVRV
jgi:hypothetical protein